MADPDTYPDWIAVDWGTSQLRAWAMTREGNALAHAHSDDGMGRLARDDFEPALLKLISPWLGSSTTQVVACGMVGSRQGWVEAPYQTAPCLPLSVAMARAPTLDRRLDVFVIPGIKQSRPADVMRGEETQIAGFVSANPGFAGILCLPGTHTKWVEISAGEVVSFQTAMTGEIFACLAQHTVLRHTVSSDGWDEDAFDQALVDTLTRPERLAASLFSLRAEGILNNLSAAAARARLSGTLIGAELASTRPYWLGREVAIIGTAALSRHYLRALAAQGVAAHTADADAMTLGGLRAAHRYLCEDT